MRVPRWIFIILMFSWPGGNTRLMAMIRKNGICFLAFIESQFDWYRKTIPRRVSCWPWRVAWSSIVHPGTISHLHLSWPIRFGCPESSKNAQLTVNKVQILYGFRHVCQIFHETRVWPGIGHLWVKRLESVEKHKGVQPS